VEILGASWAVIGVTVSKTVYTTESWMTLRADCLKGQATPH
jgi:hypothetical protein